MHIAHKLLIASCLIVPQAHAEADFDMASFHQHAAAMHHILTAKPACAGHDGVQGQLVMETPPQEFLPFAATTIINGTEFFTSVTAEGDAELSDATAAEVGKVFNEQARALALAMISDCKSEES